MGEDSCFGLLLPLLFITSCAECPYFHSQSAVTFAGAMAFLAIPIQALQGSNADSDDVSLIASCAIFFGMVSCIFSVASLIAASNLKRDFEGKISDNVQAAVCNISELEATVSSSSRRLHYRPPTSQAFIATL